MRSNSKFAGLVHLPSSNLDFKWLTPWSVDLGVERLIAIGLPLGDVVIELTRNWEVGLVDQTKRCITVRHIVDNDTQSDQIVNVREGNLLLIHLFVDGPEVLWASVYFDFQRALIKRQAQRAD